MAQGRRAPWRSARAPRRSGGQLLHVTAFDCWGAPASRRLLAHRPPSDPLNVRSALPSGMAHMFSGAEMTDASNWGPPRAFCDHRQRIKVCGKVLWHSFGATFSRALLFWGVRLLHLRLLLRWLLCLFALLLGSWGLLLLRPARFTVRREAEEIVPHHLRPGEKRTPVHPQRQLPHPAEVSSAGQGSQRGSASSGVPCGSVQHMWRTGPGKIWKTQHLFLFSDHYLTLLRVFAVACVRAGVSP